MAALRLQVIFGNILCMVDKNKNDIGKKGLDKPAQNSDLPSQKDLEKELSEYLAKKYGGKVKVVSQMVFPKQLQPDGEKESGSSSEGSGINFDLRPEELEAYLDEYVVKQSDAKAVLATKICTHFNRITYLQKKGGSSLPIGNIKNNIILIGPTGVGKTFLIKLIAAKLGVPFVKGDATKFSETGYVGGDVEDLVRELVQAADGDIEKAQYGIIYIDEIDKIASSYNINGPDVSRSGVQRALLKPLEETDVELKVPHDPISQIEAIERYRKSGKREKQVINTRHILFIVSGAFNGLADIVKKRLTQTGIGFGVNIDSSENDIQWLSQVKPQDLIEYGFETEFVGRLPVITVLEELNEEDLYSILKNPNCAVIISKKQDFRAYGIDLKFEDEALRALAHQAYQERTGARALVSVVERAMLPFEKKLPSLGVKFLVVTREMVEDPQGALEKYLLDPDTPSLEKAYQAIIAHERSEIISRLRNEVIQQWNEAGLALTEKRLEVMADYCLKEDLQPIEASEKVLFWVQQIKSYEVSFYNRCGIHINIEEDAVDLLLDECLEDPAEIYSLCERLANILEYGLTLVKERTGRDSFEIPKEAMENPELYINRLIRTCYKSSQGKGSER